MTNHVGEIQNKRIIQELLLKRNELKNKNRNSAGNPMTICTDSALLEIAERLPIKPEDFRNIKGIGNSFVENYAKDFISITTKYKFESTSNIGVALDKKTAATLKRLSQRLVNLNRKNKMLYLAKINKKTNFDMHLSKMNARFLDTFLNKGSQEICKRIESNKESIEIYKSLVALDREIERDIREKGENNLYLAYPFIIGRFSNEDFNVRAPLMLFPVVLNKENDFFNIKIDSEKDIVFNSHLLIANFKFNKLKKDLPDIEPEEEINSSNLQRRITEFYKDNGINISGKLEQIKKFKSYLEGEFPVFDNGHLEFEDVMVLGKFPIYSNAIQKDFDQIILSGKINKILADLLSGIEDVALQNDFEGYFDNKEDKSSNNPKEDELAYINNLNSSQEKVLTTIRKKDAIVVEGPPGTGKSQTITSLLADAVYQNKSVMLISEKKAALDVVYSRMGNLSEYTIIIDDINDKHSFYEQAERILDKGFFIKQGSLSVEDISNQIDAQIKKFEYLAEIMYKKTDFGVEVYKLYKSKKYFNFDNRDKYNLYNGITKLMNANLFKLKYKEIVKISDQFTDSHQTSFYRQYLDFVNDNYWIKNIRKDIDDFERQTMLLENESICLLVEKYQSDNFIKKFVDYFKIWSSIATFSSLYFDKRPRKFMKVFIRNQHKVTEVLRNYKDFIIAFNKISDLETNSRIFVEAMYRFGMKFSIPFVEMNFVLVDYLFRRQLLEFEKRNQEVLSIINEYPNIFDKISNLTEKKREITREVLKGILTDNIKVNIEQVKRGAEIKRKLESKRKWSVNKFIRTFSFELFSGIKIWMLTPEVASELLPLDIGLIDVVIFDEASQMYIEKGIPSILRAKKVIIAGDSKQLRPSSLGVGRFEDIDDQVDSDIELSAAEEEESLLDVAKAKYYPPIPLNFHYRSKYEELISFSNYAFYGGKLFVSPNTDIPKTPPIKVITVDGLWADRSNIVEAIEVVKILKEISLNRKNNETIGIISFNSNQRDQILDQIDEECRNDEKFKIFHTTEKNRVENGEDIGLFVKNIENVQGDERDIVIFSIGYAKDTTGRINRQFGWLSQAGGENRLNVAITRAKRQVYIVVSFLPDDFYVDDIPGLGPRLLKKYIEYGIAISNGNKPDAQNILLSFKDKGKGEYATFDSPFEEDVYNELLNAGFEVDTQVGIGGYRIDMAIKSNGKYILGIECDGKIYHSSQSARERDIHRQRYLESRGWEIYRIWSSRWWENPSSEIMKITKLISKAKQS